MPAVAGLRTALACAQALRAHPGSPERLREIAIAATAAEGADDPAAIPTDGWIDEVDAKDILRAAGLAVPEGRVVAERGGVRRSGGGPGGARGPEARHSRGCSTRATPTRCGSICDGADEAQGRLPRALGLARRRRGARPGRADGAAGCRARWSPPAPTPSSPLWSSASAGVWAEALDDVAIVPLPADADRVEAAIRSLRGAAALGGGRGPGAGRPRRAPPRSPPRAGRVLLEARLDLLELNPVVVHPDGCVALDAIARRAPADGVSPLTL